MGFFYYRKEKKPLRKYTRPKMPDKRPKYQKNFFFINAAIDDSRIAIWRNIAARPKDPECF